jgi:multidrug efflux pump subunit AcrB
VFIVPFPWPRFWRRAAIIFVVALAISLVLTASFNGGRLSAETIVMSVVDSAVLGAALAFPLTQRVYRGPRR